MDTMIQALTWLNWVKLGLLIISLALNILLLIPIIDRWIYWARLRRKFESMDDGE